MFTKHSNLLSEFTCYWEDGDSDICNCDVQEDGFAASPAKS